MRAKRANEMDELSKVKTFVAIFIKFCNLCLDISGLDLTAGKGSVKKESFILLFVFPLLTFIPIDLKRSSTVFGDMEVLPSLKCSSHGLSNELTSPETSVIEPMSAFSDCSHQFLNSCDWATKLSTTGRGVPRSVYTIAIACVSLTLVLDRNSCVKWPDRTSRN